MATVINTGLLTKDARSEFLNRLEGVEKNSLWSMAATEIKSTRDIENYRWLGSVPLMREWGTGRIAKGLRSESYDVRNIKYEATLEVDRDEISDDQTGQIRIRINELAVAAGLHKDFLLAQLLINGGAAGFLAYDGLTFFNGAHVSGASGNQDNNLTFDVAAPANPTTDEMKAAIKQAVQKMLTFKDDQGNPTFNMNTNGIVVVVPPNHMTAAMEAMSATIISNTSNVFNGLASVKVFPWLTATDTFYVLKTDGVIRPFIFQNREPIEFNSLDEGSSEEFMREKYLFGVRARYRMTYGYWQYAVKTVLN